MTGSGREATRPRKNRVERAKPWQRPTISETHEYLAHLYLRLNGYLTSGFIVHSTLPDRAKTQVDALAVRHPFNAEPERVIEPSAFLRPSDSLIDLLICEVKSHANDFSFNPGLRDDPEALTTVVRWVGLFPENDLESVVTGVAPLLKDGCPREAAAQGFTHQGVRVRALICAPAVPGAEAETMWFLPREEVLSFVHECLTLRRARSGIRYNFGDWGPWLEPLVRYFKDVVGRDGQPDLDELYRCTGAVPVKDPAAAAG